MWLVHLADPIHNGPSDRLSGSQPNLARCAPGLVAGAVLVTASLIPDVRLPALAGLVLVLLLAGRFTVVVWSVAAVIPASVYLAWQTLPPPSGVGLAWCADVVSPPVLRTVGGALLVFAAVALLAVHLRTSGAGIGLIRPSRATVGVSLLVAVLVAVGSLALGTILAAPFFGPIALKLDEPGAVLGALIFAFASGSMQEVAYRGTMLGWLTPGLGARTALLMQAIAFGASHTGPDFVTSPLPVLIAVGAGGLVAGMIVQRSRSLAFVIAVHAAFDVPLYYVAVCRLP